MVRFYKKKIDRPEVDEEAVRSAVSDVIEGKLSVRKAACKYSLKPGTLHHRIKKTKKLGISLKELREPISKFSTKYSSQQVFSIEQEKQLNVYIIKCGRNQYGLTLIQLRKLAYEYAKTLGRNYPSSWDVNKCAGADWLAGFRSRNSNLKLKKPENVNFTRSFSFNKTAVTEFYDNLEILTSDWIANFDETGKATVLNITPKILVGEDQ